jgi:lipid A disaccharide synthetase
MHAAIDRWLSNPQALHSIKQELEVLRDDVMELGASEKAADAILKLVEQKQITRAAA